VTDATVDPVAAARAWPAEDPDPETRAELVELLDAGGTAELAARFGGKLEFGTAGLRAPLGAGPTRMNRVVVTRAAAGLAAYLVARGDAGGRVVVGYDARHRSDTFAADTAAVLTGAGLAALVLPRPLPTPVLAFAIRHLGCVAGVMVTASHNPPRDNGYKVYLGDGSQIVPPADTEISAAIDTIGPLAELPRGESWTVLGDELVDAYLNRVAGLPLPGGPRELRTVYTPLHGVGQDILCEAFVRAGFPAPLPVPEQAAPDPDFPTVAFPNPEEPGAVDLAVTAARAAGADLVLANDPDADRCAVAVPDRDGAWRMLTGDEVGALLAAHLVRRGDPGAFATTIVSSSLLGKIAARHGRPYAETLTGFKWLARVDGLAFAYEEALGYCVDPAAVRDKDGISAAVLVAELAADLRTRGRTLRDELDDLARAYGLHATGQLAVRVSDLGEITAAMTHLRGNPPAALGGLPVQQVEDLAEGVGGLPPTDGLRLTLGGGARVVVRPSGTEPKLKCYLELVVPVRDTAGAARAEAAAGMAAVEADLAAALGIPSAAGPR
jgi:phosphomannomutase